MTTVLISTIADVYLKELSQLHEVGWFLDVSHLHSNQFRVTGENYQEGRACEWIDELNSIEQARFCALDAIVELCSHGETDFS